MTTEQPTGSDSSPPASPQTGGRDGLGRGRKPRPVPSHLGARIAATAERIELECALRDALIVEAVAGGASLREVGKAAGLTHAGVAYVVEKYGQSVAEA